MDEGDDFISKTRRKKQAHDVQALGVSLAKLSREQFGRIAMPEELREALVEARRFTRHEAIRRQMQYVGKMMRDMDVGPIAEQLAALHAPSKRQTALFHVAERWRDEMLADPGAVVRFAAEFPGADAEALRTLAAAALAERQAKRPPKRFRELFHAINALVQARPKEQA